MTTVLDCGVDWWRKSVTLAKSVAGAVFAAGLCISIAGPVDGEVVAATVSSDAVVGATWLEVCGSDTGRDVLAASWKCRHSKAPATIAAMNKIAMANGTYLRHSASGSSSSSGAAKMLGSTSLHASATSPAIASGFSGGRVFGGASGSGITCVATVRDISGGTGYEGKFVCTASRANPPSIFTMFTSRSPRAS